MKNRTRLRLSLVLASAMMISFQPMTSFAQQTPVSDSNAAMRDGKHDFDFNFGTWRTHIKRLIHPLSGSAGWTTMEGTVTVIKIWGGSGQVEDIEADGANGHWSGLTVFLYNPQSHQWSQTFAGKSDGTLEPPIIGEFKNGRGELYGQDTYNGRSILVKGVWTVISANAHSFEQSFSADGGKTWEVNFVGTLERISQ